MLLTCRDGDEPDNQVDLDQRSIVAGVPTWRAGGDARNVTFT